MWVSVTAFKDIGNRRELVFSRAATSVTEFIGVLIEAIITDHTVIIIKGDWK